MQGPGSGVQVLFDGHMDFDSRRSEDEEEVRIAKIHATGNINWVDQSSKKNHRIIEGIV